MNQAVAGRALLVGYHDVGREVLRRLLRACGCEAVPVDGPHEAEAQLDGVDRVFIDLNDSARGTVRLLRTIRQRGLPVKVAVTTPSAGEASVAAASRWRPDVVFVKPLEFPALATWLKQ